MRSRVNDQDARASSRVRHLARASQLGVAIDLDGTLIPFARTPRDVEIDSATFELRAALVRAPRTTIAIVSGRPKHDLDAFFGDRAGLLLAAEHGVWTRADDGWA